MQHLNHFMLQFLNFCVSVGSPRRYPGQNGAGDGSNQEREKRVSFSFSWRYYPVSCMLPCEVLYLLHDTETL